VLLYRQGQINSSSTPSRDSFAQRFGRGASRARRERRRPEEAQDADRRRKAGELLLHISESELAPILF
jgi:hypothetical protein